MTQDNANGSPEFQPSTPDPALKRLGDALLGMWEISGDARGQATYEWMDGGFFLIQHIDLEHGQKNKGIEIIGREQKFGDPPSKDIKSRYYGSTGETFDYVYELDGNTLTIWGGERGSPAFYRGKISADGNTLKGSWQWRGGGYETTSTRVK
jgi:hypothetical protein